MKLKQFIRILETEAPLFLAENWDNPGLQVGNPDQEIKKILVALQFDHNIFQEALEKKVDLIFTHHPFIFRPLPRIDFSDYKGNLISELIKNNISLYSAHTNLDSSPNGINEQIIKQFPIEEKGILKKEKDIFYQKISVYYPAEDKNKDIFIEKVLEKGNTSLGNYTKCGFYSTGAGCFQPDKEANPHLGEKEEFNQVAEIKLEFVVAPQYTYNTISAIRELHPYEEPLILLEELNYPVKQSYGIGRWGKLEREYSWEEFIELTKKIFGLKNLRCRKFSQTEKIRKIGLVGGVGIFYLGNAVSKNCDVYITSDIKHHEWDMVDERGISLVEVTHFKMESLGLKSFFDEFKNNLLEYEKELEIVYSQTEKESFEIK